MNSNPSQTRRVANVFGNGAIIAAALVLLAILGCNQTPPNPPAPSAPNAKLLCFPQFRAIPEAPSPPNIDGNIGGVPGDLGWTFSSRYVFGNGTSAPDAIVQIVKDASYVYLSFEVNNDTALDDEDAILLVFRPTGVATNDRRIVIFPNSANVMANGGSPRQVSYWNNSTNWNTPTAATNNPAWLLDNAGAHGKMSVINPDFNHWYVEMKIPIGGGAANNGNPAADSAINLPAAGDFGFYFDIIRIAGTADEFEWPEGKVLAGMAPANVFTPEANTPPDTDWGNGTFTAQACNGVNFDWYDIKIDHAGAANITDSQIALNNTSAVQNIFTLTLHNDSVDKNNNYITAPDGAIAPPAGLVATFKIRNYGVAGATQWDLVGNIGSPINLLTPNPTTPGVQVPAATAMPALQGSTTISTNNWKLNASQQTLYSTASTPDQCILAEIGVANNTPGIVSFKNKAAYRNMNFVVTNSPFSRIADLGTHGYKLEGDQKELEFYLNTFTYFSTNSEPWETKIENAQQLDKNQYLVRARPEESFKLAATVSPPAINLPSEDMQIAPGTAIDNTKLMVKVKPGDLVTILSEGSIQVRRSEDPNANLAGPNGFDSTRREAPTQPTVVKTQSSTAGTQGFLLAPAYEPQRHIGALAGCWDQSGKNCFLIGSLTTLKVPKNAETLFLALNDTREGYGQQVGNGFHVQAIVTPMDKVYTYTNSLVSRDPAVEPFVVPAAVNLPTWILCGGRKTNRSIKIGNRVIPEVENIGCYGYAINRIGKAPTGTNPGPTTAPTKPK